MKTCIILNPHAGKGAVLTELQAAAWRLGDAVLRVTQQPGDAERLSRQALRDGYTLIVAAGGDGTITGVVNGLAEDLSQSRLGIIPLGTANDFARSLDIPLQLDAAIDLLAAGHVRLADVVRVTGDTTQYAINVSAGGFSGLVDETLDVSIKRTWGALAYLRSAVEALPNLVTYHAVLTFDDAETVLIDTYNIIIANARYAGGGISIAPQAQLDDGQADVVVVRSAPLPQLALLVPQIILGHHFDSNLVLTRRVRKVAVRSRPDMVFNVDGELVGQTPLTFEMLPRALRVVAKEDS